MKNLTQVQPRIDLKSLPGSATAKHIITESGSYYLTGDVVGELGRHGIEIAVTTGNLSIDLEGFSLTGLPGSLNGIHLPAVGAPPPSITIRRGTIQGWGGDGIHLPGAHGVIHASVLNNNGGLAIRVGDNSRIHHCEVRGGGNGGTLVGNESVISDSTLHGPLTLANHCIVQDSIIDTSAETVPPIVVGDNCFLRGSKFRAEGTTASAMMILGTENTVQNSDLDMDGAILSGSLLEIMGNKNIITENSFCLSHGAGAMGSVVSIVGNENILVNNASWDHTYGPVWVVAGDRNVLDRNTLWGVGVLMTNVTGIEVSSGEGNQIQGNRVFGAGVNPITGIRVQSTANVVVGNSVFRVLNGTSYDIVPGNAAGPIVTSVTLPNNSNPDRNLVH
jgi:hypothetical protein